MVRRTSVVIVGGSLDGLTTALALAELGVRCVVLEQQSSTTRHPRFRNLSPRALEILRTLGVEAEIRANQTAEASDPIARAAQLRAGEVTWLHFFGPTDVLVWALRKDQTMKGKRYTTEEKIRILREADRGEKSIQELCRQENVSEVTFHRWKKQFGHMAINEARRLKELERENNELKKMLAESLLKNRVLEAVCEKKL